MLGGVLVAGLVMMAFETGGMMLFPLPPDIDVNDPASLAAGLSRLPVLALVNVVVGWLVGTCAGAAFAAWRSPASPQRGALLVGVAMQSAGIANLLSFPHPSWMIAAAAVVFVPPAWFVGGWFERRSGQV